MSVFPVHWFQKADNSFLDSGKVLIKTARKDKSGNTQKLTNGQNLEKTGSFQKRFLHLRPGMKDKSLSFCQFRKRIRKLFENISSKFSPSLVEDSKRNQSRGQNDLKKELYTEKEKHAWCGTSESK